MTLADRIVVMRDGHIEQVGTPDARCSTIPLNTFVATFIGTPPMNLLPGVIAGGAVRLADGADGAGARRVCRARVSDGQKVVLGIRPDDI